MKRSILFTAFLLLAGLWSCNKIDDPIKDTNGGGNPPPEETLQKFLVEDYTGVKCKNCPDAAKKLKELEDAFGDRIVGIAVHGGFFSPDNNPDYPLVLHNQYSLDWVNFFGINGWPIGMVNRYDYPPPGNLKSPGTWATLVNDHIDDEPKARIELSATYDTVLREVTINSDLSFLST
ncbi:MAG: hypothetical protein LPK46_00435, partial [Bacteroidota bacterium]|nr:hypothetical protein [Bacteroidota bacterium]